MVNGLRKKTKEFWNKKMFVGEIFTAWTSKISFTAEMFHYRLCPESGPRTIVGCPYYMDHKRVITYVCNIDNVLWPIRVNSKDYGKVLLDKGTLTSVLWPTAFLYIFSGQVLRVPSSNRWWGTLNFCLTCSVLRYPKAAIEGKKVASFEINIFKSAIWNGRLKN